MNNPGLNVDPDALKGLLTGKQGKVWRVVESQESAATTTLTASQAEQSRLEELLDGSKPSIPVEASHLSYLLLTPFRYPPLEYGSRFGSQYERGIFYASTSLRSAFAESAVYLWLFRGGPNELGPLAEIRDERTSFSARISTDAALDLSAAHFNGIRREVTRPDSWSRAQELGHAAREAGAQALWYPSCRAPGNNVAVLEPAAFASAKELNTRTWHVVLNADRCWFGRQGRGMAYEYWFSDFSREGKIPHPVL